MKAIQATKLSFKARYKKALKDARETIRKASKAGENKTQITLFDIPDTTDVDVYRLLNSKVIDKLRKDGYHLGSQEHGSNRLQNVSWPQYWK